jgi:hypothetical protein
VLSFIFEMGVDIQIYRSRIGIFNFKTNYTSKKLFRKYNMSCAAYRVKSNLHLSIMCARLICVLLIIGSVEINPGPTFTCTCNDQFTAIKDYRSHIWIHSYDKHFSYNCPYNRCNFVSRNYKSFIAHLNKFHDVIQNRVFVQEQIESNTRCGSLVCDYFSCNEKFFNTEAYLRHYKKHCIGVNDVSCPYPRCTYKHKNKNAFASHLTRNHRINTDKEQLYENLIPAIDVSATNEFNENDYSSDEIFTQNISENYESNSNIDTDIKPNKITELVAKFYLLLESDLLLPSSTVQEICERLKTLLQAQYNEHVDSLNASLSECKVSETCTNVIVNKFNMASTLYHSHNTKFKNKDNGNFYLGSEHYRMEYFHKFFDFIAPNEILLGRSDKGEEHKFHYIPLRESLEVILSSKRFPIEAQRKPNYKPHILKDYTDGKIYKDIYAKSTTIESEIDLIFFADELETCNPLGSSRTIHKILAVYYTIGNFAAEFRSRIESINLAFICKSEYIKQYGLSRVYETLVRELTDLSTSGIIINGKRMYIKLRYWLGDNLGQNQIGGFIRGFRGAYFCRYCSITREKFLSNCTHVEKIRNPESIEMALKKVNRLHLKSYKGVESCSPLNKIPGFNTCNLGLPPCLYHDVFEGVADYDFILIINCLIQKGWFTLNFLNRRIKNFVFATTDNKNRPKPLKIKSNNLGGSASENQKFIQFFPLMIINQIKDTGDESWQLFLNLRRICEFITAPRISSNNIYELHDLIKKYLTERQRLFPDTPLRPKHHFLRHYPSLILLFGPIIRMFTMRYESKHSYFKRVVKNSKNFISITKTFARKHQLQFAYNSLIPFCSNITDFNSNKTTSVSILNFDVQEKLKSKNIFINSVILNKYERNGMIYKIGLWLPLGVQDFNYAFGRIQNIILSNNTTLAFIMQIWEGKLQSTTGLVAVTKRLSTDNLFLFSDFFDIYPLSSYSLYGHDYIALKYSYPEKKKLVKHI